MKVFIWMILILLLLALLYFLIINILVSAAFSGKTTESKKPFFLKYMTGDIRSGDPAVRAKKKKESEEVKRWEKKGRIQEISHTMKDNSVHVASEIMPDEQAGTHKWVLLMHGYFSSRKEMYSLAIAYAANGYHCIVPDLRAQGESGGEHIGMGLSEAEDGMEWIQVILEKDPQAHIVLHGRSMGAAAVLLLAAKRNLSSHVEAAVSDSAYTSAWVMFERKLKEWTGFSGELLLPAAAWALEMRGGVDLRDARPVAAISKIRVPLLLIHGSGDRLVPCNMVYRLQRLAKCPVRVLVIEDADHVQSQQKNPRLFFETLWEFLETYI